MRLLFHLAQSREPVRRRPACDATVSHHPSAYCTSADLTTSCLKYLLRSSAVLKSTLRPKISLSSISIPANLISPGVRAGSNSRSTSKSLSGLKSSRIAEPNRDNFRIWFLLQNSAVYLGGLLDSSLPTCSNLLRLRVAL